MKQKITLSSMLLIILETICLFIPYSFIEEHWKYDASAITYHGLSTLKYKENVNILGVSTGLGKILAIIVIALMLLSLVSFFMFFVQKKNKLTKNFYYTPIISFLFLIFFAFYAFAIAEVDTTNWRYEWTINWLFYIIVAMHIITIVFAILLKTNKFETTSVRVEQIKSNNSLTSKADELKQYKELLDSGIITQEEFDAKKKQLLGL